MNLNRLKQLLKEKNLDLALFYDLERGQEKNMHYFSGYNGMGCLAVPKDKNAFIIAPLMEYERAKKTSGLRVYKWEKGKRLFESLGGILRKNKNKPRKIGICYEDFGLNVYKPLRKCIKKAKLKDITGDCLKIRSVKAEGEIKIIKKSCQIADSIMQGCIKNFKNFKTEEDVEAFLKTETAKNNCQLAFPPIVASGKSSSMPHYEPKNIKLKKGFCVIDFGVVYQGYHSDITRTIYLGKPTENEKRLYNFLLEVQNKAIKSIIPGKKCKSLYQGTLNSLGKYQKNFIHALGHGIGLQIHELPNLSLKSKERFQNNMVFTVEPGIYFEDRFGIRIEDDVLIRNGKTEALTKTPKELIVVKGRF
jgi:Xaa-Pro aminopeptidase